MNLSTFRANLLKPSVKLRYKFLLNSVDRTDMLMQNGLGTIRRDVNLSAGKALVTLNNAGGWFNDLKATNDALGDEAEMQVFINDDPTNIYTLFKGVVKSPDYEGSTVTLSIKDHNSSFLDMKVGSNESPETFWQSQGRDPAEIVLRLLRVHGGLSGLNSPANPDIFYASFARWRDQHTTVNNYFLTGLPKGQTVAQLVMIICQMTHSYIWVNNDGLVEFAPPFEPGFSYSEGNTGSRSKPGHGRDLTERDDLLINDLTVRRGYNFDTGGWTGSVSDTDATSIAKFGTFPKTIEGRIFTHNTAASAQSDLDATLVNYAFPLRFFDLIAGFPAILEDLGRELTVNDTLKSITNADPIAESMLYNLNTWEVTIKARWGW